MHHAHKNNCLYLLIDVLVITMEASDKTFEISALSGNGAGSVVELAA